MSMIHTMIGTEVLFLFTEHNSSNQSHLVELVLKSDNNGEQQLITVFDD
ncbi:hypothetical protein ACULLB_01105 [Enterococcus gallinarum]|nr:hypothetical protein [Enterococcus gallinarum]